MARCNGAMPADANVATAVQRGVVVVPMSSPQQTWSSTECTDA